MANCQTCFWADRHPDTYIQDKHFEPDFLAQNIKPGAQLPDVRIVKSCGADSKYYKSYGNNPHNCIQYENEKDAEQEQQLDIDAKREEWTTPTSRIQLTVTRNVLIVIERMSLNSGEAMDILLDVMGMYPDDLASTITHLDDMNIRGPQICFAFDYCDGDPAKLVRAAKARDKRMVKFINDQYKHSKTEEAVQRGAHLYGHKPAKK